jgi:sirohydrochlorin ferrochelatase
MTATLLVAAHGTASATGSATTRALVAALASARPSMPVELCFLDVAAPSLADALNSLDGAVVVVPLLLSAGYHVETDIPAIAAGRSGVRVAAHLGPHPLVLQAVAERLTEARGSVIAATTLLAAVPSSRSTAQAEVQRAADGLATMLGRPVQVLTLGGGAISVLESALKPVEIASYLLAEGRFLDDLSAAAVDLAVVAEPIGVHPALIELILARYDAALE